MDRWASSPVIWGSATLMVTIVSCCSLVGLAIVPLISGKSYKTFNTFFTGLAVGSLTGSAIFSLIPQAFGVVSHDKTYLYKAFVIFIGIYLFYCSERLMRLYFEKRAQDEQKNVGSNQDRNENPSREGRDNVTQEAHITGAGDSVPMTEVNLSEDNVNTDKVDQQQHHHTHHHHHHHHSNAMNPHDIIAKALGSKSRIGNRGRKPREIAPVAWMIIIGDGLHNFIDGLSIGANFISSFQMGFITSLAVIFEELPHELGDFAVLIASGMSVKQAVMFNFLSACTCYLGMIAGLLLGDLTSSASYIFALAGGMFLYIALVDMMGELSAILEEVKLSSSEYSHILLMQNLGILSGIIIIFVLSLVWGS